MPLNLNCFSIFDVDTLQSKINIIQQKYKQYFSLVCPNKNINIGYLIYPATKVYSQEELEQIVDVQRHYSEESIYLIAQEFGLPMAKSRFRLTMYDASPENINLLNAANILREELGKNNIIVLVEFDVLI